MFLDTISEQPVLYFVDQQDERWFRVDYC